MHFAQLSFVIQEREMKFENGVYEAEAETEKLRWELMKTQNQVEIVRRQANTHAHTFVHT